MEKSLIIIGGGLAGLAAGCYGRMNGYLTSIDMDLPVGQKPLFGHVRVNGVFRTGNTNGYGHMGEYGYMFEIQEMKILE